MKQPHVTDRTIGVFTAELDDAYQAGIWQGIEARARELNVGVVSFLGSRIDSPIRSEATANIAYRVIDRANVDGLIVLSSAIATFLDAGKVEALFRAKPGLPKVSVGLRVGGIASVVTDGGPGITTLVRHVVREHGRRRVALVGGPSSHAEADDRRKAVIAALESEGVAFDERLFVPGTFVQESGADAVKHLLDQGLPFDALVCTNDRMAIGAMEELARAGLRVPDDLSLIGFDGIEEGGSTTPPLSTVLQPLHELGSAAVDAICDILDGKDAGDRVLMCRPVLRESCGCGPVDKLKNLPDELHADATDTEREFADLLFGDALRDDAPAFLANLNKGLTWSLSQKKSLEIWNDHVSVVRGRVAGARRNAIAASVDGGQRAASAGSDPGLLFESGRVLIGDAIGRNKIAQRIESEKRFATMRSIGASLVGAFELATMISRLRAGLSRLGIPGGFLAVFDGGDPVGGGSTLLLNAADEERGPAAAAKTGLRFETLDLLPENIAPGWRSQHWVFEPLVFQDEPLGYLLLPGGVSDPSVYDALREQVASALKGNLLVEQIRYHEKILEAEVARRTAELTMTNRELTHEIERRTKLEEEVVSISNRVMEQIGQDLHDDLCQYLAGISMLASVARKGISPQHTTSIESLDRVVGLLKESIVRVRQIARGLMPGGLEAEGLAVAIEGLVLSARRTFGIGIDFEASEDFRIEDNDRALQIYRIVQEALNNAIKHSGSPAIAVKLYARPGGLVAEVSDRGKGMKRREPGDGMGLRIMRYRAEKANLELVIEHAKPGTRVVCMVPVSSEEISA